MVPSVQRKPDPRSRGCGETPDLQRHRKPRRRLRAGGASAPASGEGGAGAGRGSQSREAQRGAGAALWPRGKGAHRAPRPHNLASLQRGRAGVTVPIGANSTCHQYSPITAPILLSPRPADSSAPSPRRHRRGGPSPEGSPCPRVPRPPPGTRELTEATSSNAGVPAAARAPRGRKASSPPPVPLGPQLTAHRRGERRGQGSPVPGERREAAASP